VSWRRWIFAASLLGAPPLAHADAGQLELREVLASLHHHHPLIAAERATLEASRAEARAARGEFDATVNVQARAAPAGYYDPRRVDVWLEQPTPLLGASAYAGYRLTRGKVAPYYGEQRTLDRGEIRGGVRLPLLQDRSVDTRRAGIAGSEAQADAAEHNYRRLALDLEREAATYYYAWIAAGRKIEVLERLLALARERDEQIRASVALGAAPSIEGVDNQRTIFERERQLVLARRTFEKGAIDLSLYLRDPAGAPLLAARERLPRELPSDPALAAREEAERAALRTRPELKALDANLRAAQVDQTLADNRVLPKLDVFGEASRDFGHASPALEPTLAPTVVEVGVSFSMPLWLRRARGRLAAAEAKLRALEQKRAFARDKAVAEVRDAFSQLSAARERVELARGAAEAALKVAEGERERFGLGATTVLFVNLREQAAADAEIALIDSLAEAQTAIARVLTASGESLFE
jgi:cobalt-zinc-cadmium efflux system outer membrane protein